MTKFKSPDNKGPIMDTITDKLVTALRNCYKLASNCHRDELPTAIIMTASKAIAEYEAAREAQRERFREMVDTVRPKDKEPTMDYELNETNVCKVLTTVDAGLVEGVGKPIPGQMCVEAAVCHAMGLPHSDHPVCVGGAVRAFVVHLNDSRWSSSTARAAGMRKLAVAQLGSERIDQQVFADIVAEQTIRRIVPIALRAAAKTNPAYAELLEAAAVRCESEGAKEAGEAARKAAYAAAVYAATNANAYAANAAIYASNAAADANAAVKQANAAANAAADAVAATTYAVTNAAYAANAAAADAYAAIYTANAAANAAVAGADAAVAYAAATTYSAYAANAAVYASDAAEHDHILCIAADIGLQALIQLKSPGCDYLWLCDEVAA